MSEHLLTHFRQFVQVELTSNMQKYAIGAPYRKEFPLTFQLKHTFVRDSASTLANTSPAHITLPLLLSVFALAK